MKIQKAVSVTKSLAKKVIKKLATPRDVTEGGKYEVSRVGNQLIRTKTKK